ncbi:hypothetical protein DSECCO2_213280 [anaerobic digester metagenome]
MKWEHKTMKCGRISFAFKQGAEIVNGVFEAPDDPGLAERLKALGHTPVPEEVIAEVINEVTGEGQDGAPTPDEERPAGGKSSKKGR